MGPDFSRRSNAAELMDGPCDYETFRGCLHDLAQVNVVTLAHRATIEFLDGLRRQGLIRPGQTTRIIDVGSGYGDLLRTIDRWGVQHGLSLQLTGVDLNPWSAKAAREVTARPIRWSTSNVFDYAHPCDVVVSSLFTHHLDDAQLLRFARWMEMNASVGWFINDLHRHPVPYYGFALLSRLMRWHPFVQHDGPVSIARAFRREDWLTLLRQGGVQDATVRWRFPFRLCVSRIK